MNTVNQFLRQASSRWIIAGFFGVLLIGLFLTMGVAWKIKAGIEHLNDVDFEVNCTVVKRDFTARLNEQARILWSGAALLTAAEPVTREVWHSFTEDLDIEHQLPGIQGLGFSVLIPQDQVEQHTRKIREEGFPNYQIYPAGEREWYTAIVFLEPFSGRNLRAFGYDMFSEPVRRLAMEKARDTDSAILSGKVILVQETDREIQSGTLMYVPVYKKGLPKKTIEQRRAAIIGWVYSPYRMSDLCQGILQNAKENLKRGLHIALFDGDHPSSLNQLFSSLPGTNDLNFEGRLKKKLVIDFNGHRWTLLFAQSDIPLWSLQYASVWLMVLCGTVCTLLTCFLLKILWTTQRKALQLAHSMTADLHASKESLMQAKERLTLAVRAGRVGIWEYDIVNKKMVWDDQMLHLYGITRDQFSGLYEDWLSRFYPEDRQRGDELMQLAIRGDRPFEMDFRILWPDGTLRYICGFANVLRDASGRALHMIGTNWDISDMKHVEDHVKRQSSLINSLLDSMPDIIFFKNIEGHYLGCNPHFAELVGKPREEIIGRTDADLFEKGFAKTFRMNDLQMLAVQEPRHNEEWVRYPDGHTVLLDTLKTPYWGQGRELIGILGISRDVTAQHQAEVALRESEANFRTFFETMTDMIFVATSEGRILLANAAVSKTLGYTAEELSTMRIVELRPKEARDEAEAIIAAIFRGERDTCPMPLLRKDGCLIPVETRIWMGQWNGVKCLFCISKNLSAEQEANQRFESLFHNNLCPIALSSISDRLLVDVNDAFLTTFGFTREEVVGHNFTVLALFAHREQQEYVTKQLEEEGRITDYEIQVRCKDGSLIDGLFCAESIYNQGKRYFLAVLMDITARKRAEKELARLSVIQRDLMCFATEFVNVPLEQQDAAINQSLATMGRLIHADRACLFAYDFNAGIATNTHAWCNDSSVSEKEQMKTFPITLDSEWTAAHQRGEYVYIPSVRGLPDSHLMKAHLLAKGTQSLITLPLMQGKECYGFVGFTAIKQEQYWASEEIALLRVLAELYANFEARRKMERATQELQQRLTQARDAAQEAARAKSLFLGNMSHEIRTPLNTILGYAQIMERECREMNCPNMKMLTTITRSGQHLLELLTDLLELVRSDAKKIKLSQGVFDLYQAIEDVRIIFLKHPAAQMLSLDISFAPDVPQFICSDSGKIRQVLVNLVSNAVKFTEQGGVRLLVSVLSAEHPDVITLAVDVEDTGCGIAPEEQKHLFELFYTHAEGTRNATKGTGLGLPLSRRYAQALGGDVQILQSAPGKGSCFRFTFCPQRAHPDAMEQSKGIIMRLAPDQSPCRILVVDDDGANCEMLRDMLMPLGFHVEIVASGAAALQRIQQAMDIEVILMDKRMPDLDGYETTRRLRQLPGGEQVSVIIVTATGDANERDLALAVGAKGYVAKPVHRENLLEEIGRVAGLHYVYQTIQASTTSKQIHVEAAHFARLSDEICHRLHHALRRGDIRTLRELVEIIAHDDAELADGLRELVNTYDYDRLNVLLAGTQDIRSEPLTSQPLKNDRI